MEVATPITNILLVFMVNGLLIDKHTFLNRKSLKHKEEWSKETKEFLNAEPSFHFPIHETHTCLCYKRNDFDLLRKHVRNSKIFSIGIWDNLEKHNLAEILCNLFPHPQNILIKFAHNDVKEREKIMFDLSKVWEHKNNRKIGTGFKEKNTIFIVPQNWKSNIIQQKNTIVLSNYNAINSSKEDKELSELLINIKYIEEKVLRGMIFDIRDDIKNRKFIKEFMNEKETKK